MIEENVQNEYFELLKFESVGGDPSKFRECVECASYLRRWLGKLGFENLRLGHLVVIVHVDGICAQRNAHRPERQRPRQDKRHYLPRHLHGYRPLRPSLDGHRFSMHAGFVFSAFAWLYRFFLFCP